MADQPRKRKGKGGGGNGKTIHSENEVKTLPEPVADPGPHIYTVVAVVVAFLAMVGAFIWLNYDTRASQSFERFIANLMPKNRYQKKT